MKDEEQSSERNLQSRRPNRSSSQGNDDTPQDREQRVPNITLASALAISLRRSGNPGEASSFLSSPWIFHPALLNSGGSSSSSIPAVGSMIFEQQSSRATHEHLRTVARDSAQSLQDGRSNIVEVTKSYVPAPPSSNLLESTSKESTDRRSEAWIRGEEGSPSSALYPRRPVSSPFTNDIPSIDILRRTRPEGRQSFPDTAPDDEKGDSEDEPECRPAQ
jgi:hypothetical protein